MIRINCFILEKMCLILLQNIVLNHGGDHLPFTFKFVERNLSIADIGFLKNGQRGMDECKEAFASPLSHPTSRRPTK